MADINVSALTGATGGSVSQGLNNHGAGYSVSIAGDINGDGIDDLIVSAPASVGTSSSPGRSYIVYGKSTWGPDIDLPLMSGPDGLIVVGINDNDFSGLSVSSAGDLNNDGRADLVVGAPGVNTTSLDAGTVYVLFGKASYNHTNGQYSLSNVTHGQNGLIFYGANQSDLAGYSVSSGGDINGDGIDDLLIGSNGGSGQAGEAYVVFGKGAWGSTPVNLGNLNGSNGIRLTGLSAGDLAGKSISFGDVNGDGRDDIIVGAEGSDFFGGNTGETYIHFGKGNWTANGGVVDLTNVNGVNGVVLRGTTNGERSGAAVSSGTDINGDGIDDILIGAPGANFGGAIQGSAYVVYGRADWSSTSGGFRLSDLNGVNGFRLDGAAAGGGFGSSVTMAGDVNRDGFGDMLIGAPNAVSDSGFVYSLFGGPALDGILATNNINNVAAFRFLSESAGGQLGASVGLGGDINGDGVDDIVMGEPLTGLKQGKAHFYFGQADWGPPALLQVLPAPDDTLVDPRTSLVFVFSEPIYAQQGGVLEIRERDNFGALHESIDINSTQVYGSGSETIVVSLNTVLKSSTRYYVLLNSGALDDFEGLPFKGYKDATEFVFTTGTLAQSTGIPTSGGIIYDALDFLRLPVNKVIQDLTFKPTLNDFVGNEMVIYQPFGSAVDVMTFDLPGGTKGKDIFLPSTGLFNTLYVDAPPTLVQYNNPPKVCGAVKIHMNADLGVLFVKGLGEVNVEGSENNDNIVGNAANNCFNGNGGADRLRGGSGFDLLYGGTGADLIYGNWDDDWLLGNEGADHMYGGQGNDRMFGNEGNDHLEGNLGNDFMNGNVGNDTLEGKSGTDKLLGSLGEDLLLGGPGNDHIEGNTGNDVIRGNKGNDMIYGNVGIDLIFGNEDRDTIFAGWGTDRIFGGSGSDSIDGQWDDDLIYGNSGADTIRGSIGRDIIYGNKDADVILGGTESDLIYGGSGGDRLLGQAGADTLFGGDSADIIYGNPGDDLLRGAEGSDSMFGGSGADTLHGGQGNDWIKGNKGDDIISGNRGYDTLFGGSGADIFYFNADPNHDVIVDFIPVQNDKVWFWPTLYDYPEQILAYAIQLTTGVQLTSPNTGHTVMLRNKTLDQLDIDDFYIVEWGMGI